MSQHPLIDLAALREIRQSKGFREIAAGLTGVSLAAHYKQEISAAPKRHAGGKRYLGNHPSKPPSERKNHRDEEHLSGALFRYFAEHSHAFRLPREAGEIRLIDFGVPLTAPVAEGSGEDDLRKSVGKADLLAVGTDDALMVVKLRYLAPTATRGGTGDTPMRFFFEGLAATAIAEANRAELQKEAAEHPGSPPISDDPPFLLLVASARWWQLARRREAQKGAAWIRELERLASELVEQNGVQVLFASLVLDGDPGWEYDEKGPKLTGVPRLEAPWERNAGRIKPKSQPKSKLSTPVVEIVEADMSRAVRDYRPSESYQPGDRIRHPTLGEGVVQGDIGPGKVRVLFPERAATLVHQRA